MFNANFSSILAISWRASNMSFHKVLYVKKGNQSFRFIVLCHK